MDVQLDFGLDDTRVTAAWMLGSFLVVFLVTRGITRLIRSGRGPFGDTSIGGVHIHHLVHGIVLMLVAGAGEFLYRPEGAWQIVLAVGFGAGAALTLDEFALWLRLEDVYWAEQGRLSVDVVLVVAAVGALLVLGMNPFGAASEDNAPTVLGVAAVDPRGRGDRGAQGQADLRGARGDPAAVRGRRGDPARQARLAVGEAALPGGVEQGRARPGPVPRGPADPLGRGGGRGRRGAAVGAGGS